MNSFLIQSLGQLTFITWQVILQLTQEQLEHNVPVCCKTTDHRPGMLVLEWKVLFDESEYENILLLLTSATKGESMYCNWLNSFSLKMLERPSKICMKSLAYFFTHSSVPSTIKKRAVPDLPMNIQIKVVPDFLL